MIHPSIRRPPSLSWSFLPIGFLAAVAGSALSGIVLLLASADAVRLVATLARIA